MASKVEKTQSNTNKGKGLFNLGQQRKAWLEKVSTAADCYVNDVMCMLIDQASVDDPENFAVRMKKFKLKKQLEEIEAEERNTADKKKALMDALESDGHAPRQLQER